MYLSILKNLHLNNCFKISDRMETPSLYSKKNDPIEIESININNQAIEQDIFYNEINQEQNFVYFCDLFKYPITVDLLKEIYYDRNFWIEILYEIIMIYFSITFIFLKFGSFFIFNTLLFIFFAIYNIFQYRKKKETFLLENLFKKVIVFLFRSIRILFFLVLSQILL